MNEVEYAEWMIASKKNYKEEIQRNGNTEAEAIAKTEEDFNRLLPEGFSTPDQYLFSIKHNDLWVGTLWFGARGAADNRKAFIYDIVLNESVRGMGFGKKAMLLLETEVKKLGLKSIGLHVFGHNTTARALYEKCGYEITNLHLEKKL